MASTSKLTIFFVFMLLFVAGTIMQGAEARICSTPSRTFRGICVSKRNCGASCATEGFPGGECKGVRRRCMCTRPCLEEDNKHL